MEKRENEGRKRERLQIWFVSILLFFSTAIIIFAGTYCFPQADDFVFSQRTHIAWETTHSFVKVVLTALLTAKDYWMNWQGTYSSIFMMAMQPGLFSEKIYWMGTVLLILFFEASVLFLGDSSLRRLIGKGKALFVSECVLLYMILCVPSVMHAFFWYNGAMHYVFAFSVFLCWIALGVKIYFEEYKTRTGVCYIIASFYLGGVNYVSLLETLILMTAMTVVLGVKRKICQRNKRAILFYSIANLALIVGGIFNFAAPGNRVRASYLSGGENVINTIIESFSCGAKFFVHMVSPELIFFLTITSLVVMNSIAKNGKEKEYTVNGWWVLCSWVFTFCLVSALFSPMVYTGMPLETLRVQNIIFLSATISIWMSLILSLLKIVKKERKLKEKRVRMKLYFAVLFLSAISSFISWTQDRRKYTVTEIAACIYEGSVREWHSEVKRNIDILKADDEYSKIYSIKAHPSIFYSDDVDSWESGTMTYFGKKEICVVDEEQ